MIMKKIISIFVFLTTATICLAQTKTTYCDVYARGSWNNMRITIIHYNETYELYGNISTAINTLADQGWVLDESIVIPRHGLHITRHKLHFVMKKEYVEGENISILPNANRVIDLDSNISNKTNISNSTSHNESLIKTFNSDKIHKLSREQQRELAKDFVSEINYDIKNAASEQDMLLIKEKIDVLIKYNDSLPKRNFLIIDALNSIQYEYKQKAENLGIKL